MYGPTRLQIVTQTPYHLCSFPSVQAPHPTSSLQLTARLTGPGDVPLAVDEQPEGQRHAQRAAVPRAATRALPACGLLLDANV